MNKTVQPIDKSFELKNCTFAKTIMMFTIILYHCFLICQGDGIVNNQIVIIPKYYSVVLDFFSSFLNYTFVLISGYLFSYIKNEREGYKTLQGFMQNKCMRLLIPFVGVSLLWGIPWKYVMFRLTPKQVFVQWVLAINPDQLWFILMLFEVMILYWIIDNRFQKREHRGIQALLFIIIYFMGIIANEYIINVFRIFNAFQMLIFFYCGYRLRISNCNRKKLCYTTLSAYIALFILFQLTKYREELTFIFICPIMQLCMRLCGSLAVFSILQSVGRKVDWGNSKIFCFFSNLAMPIYLFHQQIVYFVVKIINNRVDIYWSVAISFLITVAVTAMIGLILKKYKITRFLIGESSK